MAKIEFAFTDLTKNVSYYITVLESNVPGHNLYEDSYNGNEHKITVLVNKPKIKKGQLYYIKFSLMNLAWSHHSMGPLKNGLSKQYFNNEFLRFYPVDNESFNESN
jgi:hypothetical protein